ncbi:tautomerase family protein (plasmid) [Rhizobium bangladeshense]|uniref:tautomerase family protein n=1 Tax=Rhizobium bangladeshense TaxID=1138189 RepID=UPI0004713528|nr:tautomerase family protein [Rhizobium bangladeshense]QSY97885.1 tautomerase family protein [Rhizobium bangladeshense]
MPFISVQHLSGAFTPEQQKALIEDITAAFVRQGGEGIRPAVHMTITEIASGLWASGGKPLTIEEVRARREAREASAGVPTK